MTYFLLLLVALAVAGAGGLLRNRSAVLGQVLMAVGGLGCVVLIVWQVRQSLFPAEAKAPNRTMAVVSYYLANQVMADAAELRGTVVLLLPPKRVLDEETALSYQQSFTPLLCRGHPDLQTQAVRLEGTAKGADPLAAFKQALGKVPGALAVVSYAGVPPGVEGLLSADQPKTPPLYVYDSERTTHWRAALKQGRIRSVIVPRPDFNPASQSGVAGSPGDLFPRFYLMATPANADEIAAQLGSGR